MTTKIDDMMSDESLSLRFVLNRDRAVKLDLRDRSGERHVRLLPRLQQKVRVLERFAVEMQPCLPSVHGHTHV